MGINGLESLGLNTVIKIPSFFIPRVPNEEEEILLKA